MGKPFAKELKELISTLKWGFEQEVETLGNEIFQNVQRPLFIVGSGGSLSACHYAASLYQQKGMMAKAITPLDIYYSRHSIRNSNVLFISASGKNTDILFGYKSALSYEPNKVFGLCMKKETPLKQRSTENSISNIYEFDLPVGKDGFLATNSLVAFFSLLYRSASSNDFNSIENYSVEDQFFEELDSFMGKVNKDFTFNTLFAGWGQPIAFDIESKLAEAALSNVLLTDYRNFGHGRHHWFDKRKENSAIIALITPEEEKIAEKTLSILPSGIPVLRIHSKYKSAFASIDLLIKSFYFIEKLGASQGIDPGRPGVPDYGSKLYNLRYSSFYKTNKLIDERDEISIVRKAKVPSYFHLSEADKSYWKNCYDQYIARIEKAEFGIIVSDYDGTICSDKNRFLGVDEEVQEYLLSILERGIVIGIATGRGKSVRVDLIKFIPEKYHERVVIGYYNCSDIGLLSENNIPTKGGDINVSLKKINDVIISYDFPIEINPELKPNQLTIEVKEKSNWIKVRQTVIQLVMQLGLPNIQILESSHSIDIVDQTKASKLNIIDYCIGLAKDQKLSLDYLCIGDKGEWPGNDYQLLSAPYSLSVDEVTPLVNSCWNVANAGVKNVKALTYYLSCINFIPNGFTIKFK